ncbi:MAG: 4-hydroxy-tetrahydrodipicolinate synthase [Streptosporangiaceae bacterium]|jgi:4-hydroxy-tetrahydrodipicolinate synthase|nr:4-hydroxy-tetrahydrodipicolinate synthase [Streptosporangiaceae bacterium]
MRVFSGVGVALVTLMDDSGAVDAAATGALAAELADRGMRGILACGTTGEAGRLSDAERAAVIGAVRAAVPPAVPVLAGTGAADAHRAAGLTAAAVRAGADAVLAWPPPGCEDLPGYYAAVAGAAAGRPVLAYHVPWVSAPGVPVEALAGLPVAGVKDSSGNPDRLLAEVTGYPGATYVGSSGLLALAGPVGAAGAILAVANAEPERCIAAFAGDGTAQRDLAGVHLAVREGGPAELKQILAARRGSAAVSRAS